MIAVVVAEQAPGRTGHPSRRLALTGVVATLVAATATALTAALLRAGGVGFEVEGGESIPVSGIAVVTGVLSGLGVVLAAAFLRWSTRPVTWWVWTAVTLTAISLVPPFAFTSGAGTVAALVGLHLLAAAVMIPALARSLGAG